MTCIPWIPDLDYGFGVLYIVEEGPGGEDHGVCFPDNARTGRDVEGGCYEVCPCVEEYNFSFCGSGVDDGLKSGCVVCLSVSAGPGCPDAKEGGKGFGFVLGFRLGVKFGVWA